MEAEGIIIEVPSVRVELRPEPRFLRVISKGRIASWEDADHLLSRTENVAIATGLDRVLWDYRLSVPGPPEVRQGMWKALREGRLPFFAVALIAPTPMFSMSVNLDAQAHRMTVRSYTEVSPAIHWLVQQSDDRKPGSWRPPRPSTPPPPPEPEPIER